MKYFKLKPHLIDYWAHNDQDRKGSHSIPLCSYELTAIR